MPRLSIEVFPGKTPKGAAALIDALTALKCLDPDFVSVTCGAGGSKRTANCATVREIRDRVGLPVAAHMTAIAASEADVAALADDYRALGVRRIVALRGDRPRDGSADGVVGPFRYASDLVAWLARQGGFEIAVAAYPETHPEAASPDSDLDALKCKIDAGASLAITQFFFDAEVFLRFRDRMRAAGITVPLLAGVLPIQSFERTRAMAESCGATVPAAVADAFAAAGDDPARHEAASLALSTDLCRRLQREGVDGLHLYALNKAAPSLKLAEHMGWLADRAAPAAGAGHPPPPRTPERSAAPLGY